MTLCVQFPGQGSQFVGMGRDLFELFPRISSLVFEEAEDAARLSIKKLCLEGPEETLVQTAFLQPALLTVSVATWRVLESESDLKPACFMGHSLGEYSALVCSERVSFSNAVKWVHRRGQAMQEAVPQGQGAMAALVYRGTSVGDSFAQDIDKKCQHVAKKSSRVLCIANENSPQQLVVSGHKEAVEALLEELKGDPESKNIRAVSLPVSAPFHSPLMAKASEVMTSLFQEEDFREADTPIVINLTGQQVRDYKPSFLVDQIPSPVKWTQSLKTAYDEIGCRSFLEVGPGRVLSGLCRKTLGTEIGVFDTMDVKKTLNELS